MPLVEIVEFVARLQKGNRVQIPVEIRWRCKLEPGELLTVRVNPIGSGVCREFVARLMRGGRITVPWEIAWDLKLDRPGRMLNVWLRPRVILT